MSDELRTKIEAHLGKPVKAVTPLAGGACQDNLRVDLADGTRLVARSDAKASLPGSLDRRAEHALIEKAVAASVKTPRAHGLTQGLVRPGAWAYFLEWVDGEALGRKVVAAPAFEKARGLLPGQLVGELAKIHSVRPAVPGDPVQTGLAQVRDLIGRLPEPRLAIELALAWLEDHPPADGEATLVHGDFRTGNFLVRPEDGLAAVLDWEFAHWGSPLEDLAWLCLRDWRFGRLDRAAGGIFARETLYSLYREATGRKVDPRDVAFWEILGNVRWAAGSAYQGERFLAQGERDLELLAIARRTAEMEYEALRLIEVWS